MFLKFIPATITEGKEWYVSYWAICPKSNTLKRKKIKVNRIKNINIRRKMARSMVLEINNKLMEGWSPFVQAKAADMIIMDEALKKYLQYTKKEVKPTTYKNYVAYLEVFREWLHYTKNYSLWVEKFDAKNANDFLTWLNKCKNLNQRSYNIHLTIYKVFFNWCVKEKYTAENPFTYCKPKKVNTVKNREPIPADVLSTIVEYIKKDCPEYLIVLYLIYQCLIRPKEICLLKIKDINF